MKIMTRKIAVAPETDVSSVWAVSEQYEQGTHTGLILAHGAGNDMHSPFLTQVHEALARRGVLTVKFNFPYKERGRQAPDRAPVLEATWRSVADAVRTDARLGPKHLFFAGKSMGGRMASHLAAAGEDCAGLVFLGYPLHPPNKPDALRAEHLSRIQCPMLFIQGTRDALCHPDLLKTVLSELRAPVTLHEIEGGDHSFKVLKRLGRSEQEVWQEIVDVTSQWLDGTKP